MEYAMNLVKSRCREQLKSLTAPRWLRGLSSFQMASGHQLHNAIRDDLEQMTTYRVQSVLHGIGLHPRLKDKDVRIIMKLSRGNDLAFLWFLLEQHYKAAVDGIYTSNEQIIMSLIYHIDLVPTLNYLDRLLPLGHAATAAAAARKAQEPRRQLKSKGKQKAKQKNLHFSHFHKQQPRHQQERHGRLYTLPYFQPLVLPKQYGNRLTASPKPFKAYSALRPMNQDGLSPFESRWFGSYKLQQEQVFLESFVRRQISGILDRLDYAGVDSDRVKSLCLRHKLIDEMEHSLVERLKWISNEKMSELRQVNTRERERRRQRIVQELQQATACFCARFREMATQQRINATHKELFVCCGDEERTAFTTPAFDYVDAQRLPAGAAKIVSERERNRDQAERQANIWKSICTACDGGGAGDAQTDCKQSVECDYTASPVHGQQQLKYTSAGDNCSALPGSDGFLRMFDSSGEHFERGICAYCKTGAWQLQSQPPLALREHQLQRIRCLNKDNLTFAEWQSLSAVSNRNTQTGELQQKCNAYHLSGAETSLQQLSDFEPATNCKHESLITRTSSKHSFSQRAPWIKRKFVQALNADIALLNELNQQHISADQVLHQAVQREAAKIFSKDVELYAQECARLLRRLSAHNHTERLDFGQETYDPNDTKTMMMMLRQALLEAAKDSHYLLPNLPEVWNVPRLLHWVCDRYGKVFTVKEHNKLCSSKRKLMIELPKIVSSLTLPKPPEIKTTVKMVSYGEHDKLMLQASNIRNYYSDWFSNVIMEISRTFYFAMRPSLSRAALLAAFYSYMPSRYIDLCFNVAP